MRNIITDPRPERPLPKKGCSVAFYLFLLALLLFLIVMFILHKNQMR
ncbi:MAG: hypothetical protein KBT45_01250 [Bacteroidales bacterium]|nr:hypothetical protein [Candidatus Colimorpha pelethequi]